MFQQRIIGRVAPFAVYPVVFFLGHALTPGQNCSYIIRSKNGNMTGRIESPGYPGDYPTNMACNYTFKGEGQQRVQIKFLNVSLHYTGRWEPTDARECSDQGDTITVIIYIDGEETVLGEYCGQKIPPILMSNGARMEVIFKSDSKRKIGADGYRFEYNFRTDFGVKGNGVQDSREVCTFEFRSRLNIQGLFTSPNIGGLYPRNTECRFLFIGRKNERVYIEFEDFDVDGLRPSCTASDESDSLSFSNYWNAEDEKMPKYCWINTPNPVQSDSSFFLVIFRSNDVYDATGFKANYTFIGSEEIVSVSQPTTQTNNADRPATYPTVLFLILYIFHIHVVNAYNMPYTVTVPNFRSNSKCG